MTAGNSQYKVLLTRETERALETQRLSLGFHSSNALCAIYLTALSQVPAPKVLEALSTLNRYAQRPKNLPKSTR